MPNRTVNQRCNIRKYGITEAEYETMLQKQDGLCQICKRPFASVGAGKVGVPAVDHDHDSKWVRGLLCYFCNLALGFFEDDLTRLQAAIEYLISNVAPTEWNFLEARLEAHRSSNVNMARTLAAESMRKRSESLKARWADPTFKAQMSEIQKTAQNRPEVKARMVESCTRHANTDEGRANRRKAGKKRQELAHAEQQ